MSYFSNGVKVENYLMKIENGFISGHREHLKDQTIVGHFTHDVCEFQVLSPQKAVKYYSVRVSDNIISRDWGYN